MTLSPPPAHEGMTIGVLASALGINVGAGVAALPLAGLAADHRKLVPGSAFFALPGTKVDGASFILDAVAAGAVLVCAKGPRPFDLPNGCLYWRMEEPRLALAKAAASFYPRQPPRIVAVTGTAGKTSVADFTRQIFARLGKRAASLGTLGVIGPDGADYGSLTTPDAITLHRRLDTLASEGVTHLAMEASSHGLDQFRLDGVRISAAAFTNLGRDHLDYHKDEAEYFAAKLRLFEQILPLGSPALINLDGMRGAEVMIATELAGRPSLTIGQRGEYLRILSITPDGFGQRVIFQHKGQDYPVFIPLIGVFQVQNVALAAAFALTMREEPEAVFATLPHLYGVPGRLEQVGAVGDAPVFVDYAHKPEALEHALRALRPFVTGKLILVIGCGGDRDAGKRPIMGRIAALRADVTIITDDNPRTEDPALIRAAILAAAPGAIEIADREQAIREGVARLGSGDALLIAGKGHETGQIIGDEIFPFSDHAVARESIEALQ